MQELGVDDIRSFKYLGKCCAKVFSAKFLKMEVISMVRKDAKFEIHDTGYIAIHGHELRRVSAWRKAYLKYAKPWSEK